MYLKSLLFVLLAATTGCFATKYAEFGSGLAYGGYRTIKLGENLYSTSFTGNNQTPRLKVKQYAAQRALEVCKEQDKTIEVKSMDSFDEDAGVKTTEVLYICTNR